MSTKLDFDTDIPVSWESTPLNPALMGEEMTSSNWFLLHAVWVKYTSDNDFYLMVNLSKKGVITTKKFIVLKDKPFMKFQLPTGQTCNEFTIGIGNIENTYITTPNFEIQSIGVLWKPIAVGARG